MASILSIGVNKEALAERHRVLREAGFDVVSSGVDDSLGTLARSAQFHIAIFGSAVSEEQRNKLVAVLLRNAPHIKIVMLYEGGIRRAEMADAVLSASVRPEDLVQTLHYLVGNQQLEHRQEGQSA
jgi:hypothetical protein